jgi:hypothetical protein
LKSILNDRLAREIWLIFIGRFTITLIATEPTKNGANDQALVPSRPTEKQADARSPR